MDYIELANLIFDKTSFFIYWIFCGYVVHFFEGEPMNKRNFHKIIIFWFLSVFSNLATRIFLKIETEDEKIVISMIVACIIYFIWLYIFKSENKEWVALGIMNYLWNKVWIEIKKKEEKKEDINKK